MTSRGVTLDTFMEEFAQLEQKIIEVHGKSNMLEVKLDDANRLVKFYLSKEKSLTEERDVLLSTVNRLQQSLQEQCNLRVENERVKEDMVDLKRRSDRRVEDREAEVQRLLTEKATETDRHQRALEAVRQQSRREVELAHRDCFMEAKDTELKKLLQEKNVEVEEMKTRLKIQEREKQSELLKLQMEFGAKLARVQSSAQINQQQHQGSSVMLPQSVFRRKLQFMQEEKNREITSLRQRIKELEEKQRISSSISISDNRLKRRKLRKQLGQRIAFKLNDSSSNIQRQKMLATIWKLAAMPGSHFQLTNTKLRHSLYSLTDSSAAGSEDEEAEAPPPLSPLQKLTSDMCKDEKTIKDLIIGRRVGFYKVRGEIGCGAFSRVKLGFHALTKDKVAVKVLDKTRLDAQAQRLLSREISSMESLQHPNLVRLFEVVETPSRLHLVLEYAGGGDLHDRICTKGKFSDNTSKVTFAQILSAIKYMHNNNIIHRDLKAENVLFTSRGCVKVADFGFSTQVSNLNNGLDTFCGSPPYAAPELFKDESYLGPPVDVWAMGVLLFFMTTGTMPFRAETLGKLRRCIINAAYTVPPWVPGPCQRLVKGILKPDPTDRYAIDQMLGCDWLLPVEFPWSLVPHEPVSPFQSLLGSESWDLEEEEEEEIRSSLEELGFTAEHLRHNQLKDIRCPVTGVYRIMVHRAQKSRGYDCPPVVRGMVRDPKREGLRAYRGLRHTSKLCVLS
ncbi:serine serine/threonine-protein kinase NIM1-like [Solea senegalensis]|uniref:non-specific serine/threonine protein kinase n=1 Tax=Solea senegalensis TaxID=28829 RepID=A0AAV6R361_SOLSE|nr:serine serine/threonine-protein kinase NIM1-like [Solea senegalensis]